MFIYVDAQRRGIPARAFTPKKMAALDRGFENIAPERSTASQRRFRLHRASRRRDMACLGTDYCETA